MVRIIVRRSLHDEEFEVQRIPTPGEGLLLPDDEYPRLVDQVVLYASNANEPSPEGEPVAMVQLSESLVI